MKRLVFSIIICLVSITPFAQNASDVPIQNISMASAVVYRLFSYIVPLICFVFVFLFAVYGYKIKTRL